MRSFGISWRLFLRVATEFLRQWRPGKPKDYMWEVFDLQNDRDCTDIAGLGGATAKPLS